MNRRIFIIFAIIVKSLDKTVLLVTNKTTFSSFRRESNCNGKSNLFSAEKLPRNSQAETVLCSGSRPPKSSQVHGQIGLVRIIMEAQAYDIHKNNEQKLFTLLVMKCQFQYKEGI